VLALPRERIVERQRGELGLANAPRPPLLLRASEAKKSNPRKKGKKAVRQLQRQSQLGNRYCAKPFKAN
jgi:hypothetical protein